jgi:hypothetical protein
MLPLIAAPKQATAFLPQNKFGCIHAAFNRCTDSSQLHSHRTHSGCLSSCCFHSVAARPFLHSQNALGSQATNKADAIISNNNCSATSSNQSEFKLQGGATSRKTGCVMTVHARARDV